MRTIYVVIDGGEITSIEVPPGFEVVVRNYDIEEGDQLVIDDDGRPFTFTTCQAAQ
jgi:hypothetical protein